MAVSRADELSLTHSGLDKVSLEEISLELSRIKEQLSAKFSSDAEKLTSLQQTLDELAQFELGRFYIKNKSLSGYWTWYIILGFKNQAITSPLEKFLVEKAPQLLATQQRFAIFQTLLKENIQSNSVVCSVPCGMMADLLTLDLPVNVQEVRFVGIDLDATVFDLAKALAEQHKVRHHCKFFQKNAWDLNIENEFDIVTSNGLNIYEKDDSKVVALYRGIHRALKNNGRLICSAVTPPPMMMENCEWDLEKINKADMATAVTIFKTILEATWSNFRSSVKTCEQLQEAGFENIEIFWDQQKMFPTFSAQKLSSTLNQ